MDFRPSHLIQLKRDGEDLSPEAIRAFIDGMQDGTVTDYQASAFLMAVYFNGMTPDETVALTQSMLESGERYDLSHIPGPKVDKHSTGGVGDKVSLILAPLAAACGLVVPMMSGRGLGSTGGTLDKLESIPGFSVGLDRQEFEAILKKVGCAMIGQSQSICPADKKLYAIRDVTATVESIPLITGSILSKKIAEGTEALILDVKMGSGAFMKRRADARRLASMLKRVGRKLGLRCETMLTSMDQPLGYAVGHSLEVIESIEVLRNKSARSKDFHSMDLRELSIQLCAQMLLLGNVCKNISEARRLAKNQLQNGSAWKKFVELIDAQGGDVSAIEDPYQKLKVATHTHTVTAPKKGFLNQMNTDTIGNLLIDIGGGRKKVSDTIDFKVGFSFHRKLGARLKEGDPLVTIYVNDASQAGAILPELQAAIKIGATRKAIPPLISKD